ncbi:MAG: DUF2244 domain-containing protein [Gammaproteobacteria bacterium]|nr:MAG: DUF2244 domain-containing protein [Gammaproteobacteria bacterium]
MPHPPAPESLTHHKGNVGALWRLRPSRRCHRNRICARRGLAGCAIRRPGSRGGGHGAVFAVPPCRRLRVHRYRRAARAHRAAARNREVRHDFERYWTRVRLARSEGLRPSRLSIGSHGRFVEIGATLDEDARWQLAQRLRRLLGPEFRSND